VAGRLIIALGIAQGAGVEWNIRLTRMPLNRRKLSGDTGNDLATAMGIPNDFCEAVDMVQAPEQASPAIAVS
jgi:hypothetical protein